MFTKHIIGSHNNFIWRVKFEDVCELEFINDSSWMSGWQESNNNKKSISQNLFVLQMFSLHLYKGKLRLLSWQFPYLAYLSAGIPGCTTNIQTILDLCVCCSDEVPFLVSGVVILHNFRIWGNKNPHVVCDLERDSAKLNVWCDLMHGRVIRFFFFPNQPWPWTCTWTWCNCMQFSSYHVKLSYNKMVDALAREHQLPGLLGHQT
jgi:hypothetical protein